MESMIGVLLTVIVGAASGFACYKYFNFVRDTIRKHLKLDPANYLFYGVNRLQIEFSIFAGILGAYVLSLFFDFPVGWRTMWMFIQVGLIGYIGVSTLIKLNREEKEFQDRKKKREEIRVPEVSSEDFERSTTEMMNANIKQTRKKKGLEVDSDAEKSESKPSQQQKKRKKSAADIRGGKPKELKE